MDLPEAICSCALEIWHSQIPRCECRVDATEAGRARLILPPRRGVPRVRGSLLTAGTDRRAMPPRDRCGLRWWLHPGPRSPKRRMAARTSA